MAKIFGGFSVERGGGSTPHFRYAFFGTVIFREGGGVGVPPISANLF